MDSDPNRNLGCTYLSGSRISFWRPGKPIRHPPWPVQVQDRPPPW